MPILQHVGNRHLTEKSAIVNELYGLNYSALVQKILQTHGFADGIAFRFF